MSFLSLYDLLFCGIENKNIILMKLYAVNLHTVSSVSRDFNFSFFYLFICIFLTQQTLLYEHCMVAFGI